MLKKFIRRGVGKPLGVRCKKGFGVSYRASAYYVGNVVKWCT